MRRHATAVERLPFSNDHDDESLHASSDYFWMLRTGIVEQHAREVWRSFRDGYAAMRALGDETGDGPPTPPQRRLRAVA